MTRLSLDGRVFVPVENTDNGTVSGLTRFHFWQEGDVFFADYSGGDVREGHIIGQFSDAMTGNMLYHCLTTDKALKAGQATATFSALDDTRLAMDIDWQWLTGDSTKGQSRYEEVPQNEVSL